MLEARDVSVRIGGCEILSNASLQLSPGQICVVIGPNGAGKSTLFKVMSGELKPTRGEVFLDGKPLSGMAPIRLSIRRAVVPQASHLSFPFTVKEVVLLGATVPGLTGATLRQEALAAEAIGNVGLEDFAERLYVNLSGGERQRVHLARALCQLAAGARYRDGPAMLLLDEPTSSLDLMHQIKILQHVKTRANAGYNVLVVLHDLNLAASFADQLVVMANGRIVTAGSVTDVFTSGTLSQVYDCNIKTNQTPKFETPFVLPHPTIEASASSADLPYVATAAE